MQVLHYIIPLIQVQLTQLLKMDLERIYQVQRRRSTIIDLEVVTRPKFARQTKHQVFFSFRNIALHFIINEMLAG